MNFIKPSLVKRTQIKTLLKNGLKPTETAHEAGCVKSTVNHVKDKANITQEKDAESVY